MVRFFVSKHAAVYVFALLVVITGLSAYLTLPRESVPEIKQPYIFITTLYPGVAAKDMENLVTRVIEEEIDGVEGLDEITSSSAQSISSIFAKFTSDVSQETAQRRVRERVDQAKPKLPKDAEEPVITELSSSTWPILTITISNPNGLAVIDRFAKDAQNGLKRINGVLDVTISGNIEKEVAIDVDPLKLKKYGFTLNNVVNAIRSENSTIPGGTLETDYKNYTLNVTGEIKDPEKFKNIVISNQGVKAKIKDVANVSFTWSEPKTYSRINGKPCITLQVSKRSGKNLVSIIAKAKEYFNKIEKEMPDGTTITYTRDSSKDVKNLIEDLENNIVTAFLLVFFVTVFFLGKKNALFVSLAIPFSMLMSFTVLQFMGITLNMIVLFSLVLALGMLVDNGIVIVENIFRHASMGKNRVQAAIDGSQEVAMPIFASTLTTLLAFFPIIFMPGVMGDFMSYMPKTVIVVLSSSLLVAITINPVFCASFLNISEKNMKKITEGSGMFVKFQEWYTKRLESAVRHKYLIIFISTVVVLGGFIAYAISGNGTTFFPIMDPQTAVIKITTPSGTPLNVTDTIARKVDNIAKNSPASLRYITTAVGQAAADDIFSSGSSEPNKANITVEYEEFKKRKIKGSEAIDTLKKRFDNIAGANIIVQEMDQGPPTGHPISFEVNGNDYSIMGKIADTIMNIISSYKEFKIVDNDFESAKPEISIEINRERAAFFGISTYDISSTIRTAISGSKAGTFKLGKDEFDINVRYDKKSADKIENLKNIMIANHDDDLIPLSSVAKIRINSSIAVIKRRNLNRAVQIWADFKEGVENKQQITKEINSKVFGLKLPDGYRVGHGGGLEMRTEAQKFLMRAFMIAILLIFVVLVAQFNSIAQPFIIMVTVLLSMGGVFWGYTLTGMDFVVIMTGIGIIALTGVVVNNGIVLIDYTNLLIKSGMPYEEAVITAGRTRLRPVLLTAITTVLGMLPMAIGVSLDFHGRIALIFGSESGQMWIPFAWTMIFGLSFATVMTLVVVPSMLSILFKFTIKETNA